MPTDPVPIDIAVVQPLIDRHRAEAGGLLPLLHALQVQLGHLPDAVVGPVAAAFNLSRAEVHGVITYYPVFRRTPPGRTVVQVCRAEACQACGADELLAHVQARLGCAPHETRADGAFTLEPVFCLGLCASSPAVRIGNGLHARVTPQQFDRLLDAMEAGS